MKYLSSEPFSEPVGSKVPQKEWDRIFGPRLTPRELKVAQMVSAGMSNAGIGKALGTTENTVKQWVKTIFDKTGMGNRVELAVWYDRRVENR